MNDIGITSRTIFYTQISNEDTNATDACERVRRELIRMRRHRLKRRIFSHFKGRYLRKHEIARYTLGYQFRELHALFRNISHFFF